MPSLSLNCFNKNKTIWEFQLFRKSRYRLSTLRIISCAEPKGHSITDLAHWVSKKTVRNKPKLIWKELKIQILAFKKICVFEQA